MLSFSSSVIALAFLAALSPSTTATTREMYRIRPSGVQRTSMKILDLGTFLLTNSEDGRPKAMAPFYLNIFETDEPLLSDESITNVEEATNDFLLAELQAAYSTNTRNQVIRVKSEIYSQERFVTNIEDRRLKEEHRSANRLLRGLNTVPGAKTEMRVNVTFDREPSPDASYVDGALQTIMQDLTHLASNITATGDSELSKVWLVYREEIYGYYETPTVSIQEEIESSPKNRSLIYIFPFILCFVFLGALLAMFVIKRRRRREEEANEKVREDLAFLEDESNLFSFENSPTKSTQRKRGYGADPYYDGGDEESSRYSQSQGSASHGYSPNGIGTGVHSPTARSFMSGASTVKVSNARSIPQPSKLSELASNSLFAFSEEDEDAGSSDNSQNTPISVAPSETSNASSVFNRIMNGKLDAKSTPSTTPVVSTTPGATSGTPTNGAAAVAGAPLSIGITSLFSSVLTPQQESNSNIPVAGSSPVGNTEESSNLGGGATTTRSVVSSIFSSMMISQQESNSHIAESTLTVPVDNTTEAMQRKRSLSCSPRVMLGPQKSTGMSPASATSRAKSEQDFDEDADSVFDFLSNASPTKKSTNKTPNSRNTTADEKDIAGLDLGALGSALDTTDEDTSNNAASSPLDAASFLDESKNEESRNSVNLSTVSLDNLSTVSLEENSNSKSSPSKTSTKTAENVSPEQTSNKEIENGPPATRSNGPKDDDSLSLDTESLSDVDLPGAFPRKSRRHAKSTTQDGTTTYQTNAMQPNDWSMTDGLSDDDTLSEQGGSGAFPKSGFGSQKNRKKEVRSEDRSSNHSRPSPRSNAESENSQASASRQLINDLVWLSKKIAGVKQSAVVSAPGETPPLGAPPPVETIDSLSYASHDAMLSPASNTTGGPSGTPNEETLPSPATSPSKHTRTASGGFNSSIVCRDCFAPPGKLNIVIHSTKDGPAVHDVKPGSSLEGRIFPGDLIISVDDIDTRSYTAAQLMKMMTEKTQSQRKITVLHFENEHDNKQEQQP